MRFSVEAAALKSAFATLNPVLVRKGFTPIVENVLLDLSGDTLEITSNDLDHAARIALTVAAEESGKATVNAMRLKGIADTAPDGAQISLAATADPADGAEVRCGRSRFRLATLPAKDFPVPPPVKGISLELQPGELAQLLSASVSSSFEHTRYYLNGVFLHRKGKELCATATDGHKLAYIPLPLPEGGEEMEDNPDGGGGYIIPNAALRHLSAMAGNKACRLSLSASAVEVSIRMGSEEGPLTYRTKLVDGQFPFYSRVIPDRRNFDGSALVDTARFRAALKRCSVALSAVESADAKAARKPKESIALNFEDNVLRLEAAGDYGENASEEMDVEWGAAALRCGFNWHYLDAIAEAVDSERMRFWPSADGPARFEPETEDGRVYVVMPVRL